MIEELKNDGAKVTFTPPPPLPLTGWALLHFLDLDEARPGFLARMLRAGSRRRQTVYACLAAGALDRPREFADLLGYGMGWHGAVWPALLAEALLEAHPRDLLRTAFGSLPDGLLPLLARGGPDPLPQALYGRLYALYGDPRQRRRQRLLSDLPKLTEQRLNVVETLPPCVLHERIFPLARHLDEALEIAAAVEAALAFTPATSATIWKSVSDLGEGTRRAAWISTLLEGFDRTAAQPDVSAIPEARLLDTGAKLKAGGHDLRNCLGRLSHHIEVMHGRAAFAVLGEPEVVVTLRSVGEGWCVTALNGKGNEIVPDAHQGGICRRFSEAGFPILGGSPGLGGLERLRDAGRGFFMDELDGF